MKDLLARGLPKWPQMLVRGVPVSVEQAKEIIRRTDSFFGYFGGGNDHAFCESVAKRLRFPQIDYSGPVGERLETFDLQDEWRKQWGWIGTEYVHNSWIASAFIYGSHGWCHPDGTIAYLDNVGKWPSVETVLNDWRVLAREFPFLDLGATLQSGEECEEGTKPVVSFHVHNGLVDVIDPAEKDVLAAYPTIRIDRSDEAFMERMLTNHECGIPLEWIDEWAALADERMMA
jgi:hypothetical protein